MKALRAAVLVSTIVIGVALLGYAWSGSHKLVPGLRGCELVRSTAARGECIEGVLRNEMRGRSVRAGLVRVDRLAARNKLVSSHCHLAMHPIGERIGRRSAREGDLPPRASGSSTCKVGYLHGSMIGYVAGSDDVRSALSRLCSRSFNRDAECAHVLGHILARRGRRTGPERTVARGCQGESRPATADECVRGGMMEIALMEAQPPIAAWAARCRRAPARVREECYAWLGPIAEYRRLPKSTAERECRRLRADTPIRRDCDAGVARGMDRGIAPPKVVE